MKLGEIIGTGIVIVFAYLCVVGGMLAFATWVIASIWIKVVGC